MSGGMPVWDDPDRRPASPVALDRYWSRLGLPAFTAFARLPGGATLDTRVFQQGLWWVTADGAAQLLSEMTAAHLRAVLAMLRRHPEHYYAGATESLLMLAILLRHGTDRAASRDVEGQLAAALRYGDREDEWMEATPLVRGIREELRTRAGTS